MRNPISRLLDIKEVEADVQGTVRTIKEKQHALKLSIKEGTAASFSSGMGDSFISPFAKAIGASTMHFGILSSLTGLIGPLSQFFGSKLLKHHSRKRIVTTFVLLQAFAWILISAIAALFYFNIGSAESFTLFGIKTPYLVLALIFSFMLIGLFGSLAAPAWFSWMGDLVPENERGKYFSKRNTITGSVGLLAFLLGAIILRINKITIGVMFGFVIIFFLAFVFRAISFRLFKKQFSPGFRVKKSDYFSFWAFLKRHDNFGKFAIYQMVFHFALMFASPFFSYYMLQELGFENNYLLFTAVTMSSSIFHLLFTPLMGKISDKFGNKKLLLLGNICFSFSPIMWMIFKNPIALIIFPQMISGLANAAFTLGFSNYTYDAVSPHKRPICLAYTNILIGIGTFFGSILGGIVLEATHGMMYINNFMLLFGLAALMRLLVAILFLPMIDEVKQVQNLPPIRISFAHPFKALHAEIGWFKVIFK